MTFSPGQMVQLKSGGYPMRVVECDGAKATVAWRDAAGAPHSTTLPIVCLKPVASIRMSEDDGSWSGIPIGPIAGDIRAIRTDGKLIGTLPAGSTVERLSDGRLIAVHPEQPPKVIDGLGIREISLSADDLASIGALKFPPA